LRTGAVERAAAARLRSGAGVRTARAFIEEFMQAMLSGRGLRGENCTGRDLNLKLLNTFNSKTFENFPKLSAPFPSF